MAEYLEYCGFFFPNTLFYFLQAKQPNLYCNATSLNISFHNKAQPQTNPTPENKQIFALLLENEEATIKQNEIWKINVIFSIKIFILMETLKQKKNIFPKQLSIRRTNLTKQKQLGIGTSTFHHPIQLLKYSLFSNVKMTTLKPNGNPAPSI